LEQLLSAADPLKHRFSLTPASADLLKRTRKGNS
jgi:hypothetical protein